MQSQGVSNAGRPATCELHVVASVNGSVHDPVHDPVQVEKERENLSVETAAEFAA